MELGIVTIAYNGYGRFLPQWCRSIARLTQPPAAVTAVLGPGHGATPAILADARGHVPLLPPGGDGGGYGADDGRHAQCRHRPHTPTEWIMYLSVDDAVLPHAIEEYERYESDADYICIRWLTRGLGKPVIEHVPKVPAEMAEKYRGRGFIVGHSPYRRSFWQLAPYEEHDYPNAPFLAAMVENHARFVKTERPCTIYQRRHNSHCRGILFKTPSERRKAVYHKKDMERRIVRYFLGT